MVMKVVMKDWLMNLERSISNMDSRRRIIYFKSESRHIIEDAVNCSNALWTRAGLDYSASPRRYQELEEQGRIRLLNEIYCQRAVLGTIDLNAGLPKGMRAVVPELVVLSDFHVVRGDLRAALIKAFLDAPALKHSLLLLSSPEQDVPDGFFGEIELVMDPYISEGDICRKLTEQVRQEEKQRGKTFFTDRQLRAAAKDFIGLTADQVDEVLKALKNMLCVRLYKNAQEPNYMTLIHDQRKKEAEKDSTIVFKELQDKEHVAGMDRFSSWLNERKDDFADPDAAVLRGIPVPRGILICGVPGTGKTAMAKETARKLNVPLIAFDISRVQSSKFGETEIRLRRYLDRINGFGKCVLLMDEIEKVFAVSDGTHEVRITMIGILLDWMQEHKNSAFLFITANQIQKLPVELLRDGRLNERFFAFMPARDDLAAILQSKLMTYAGREENALLDEAFEELLLKREWKEANEELLPKQEWKEANEELLLKREWNGVSGEEMLSRELDGASGKEMLSRELDRASGEEMLSREWDGVSGKLLSNYESGDAGGMCPLAELSVIFDRIAEEAKADEEKGRHSLPFMTGANLEKLVENTFRALHKSRKKAPYSYRDFADQMVLCAASSDFVPQGQSNTEDLVTTWLDAQKRQYINISKHEILPFFLFHNGRFSDEMERPGNAYDDYMQQVLKEKIENAYDEWHKAKTGK